MGIKPGFLREENGSALVFMALSLVVVLMAAALVTDVGIIYYNKTQVANAADAAALAGAQALPDSPSTAETMARLYGAKNNVSDLTVNIVEDGRNIEVRAQRSTDLFFARVAGFNSSTALALARAGVEPITGVKGIVPLGINEQTLVYGETYVLKYAASDDPEGEYHPGWLGILALQGPGAKLYLEDLKYGFDEVINLGDILNVQTGNISGNTYDGIQYRIDQCKHTPSCSADSYHPDCTRIILVPVIRESADKKQVQVMGFSAFFIDSVAGMGTENYITGEFLYHVVAGTTSSSGPDYGLYGVRLTQ